MSKGNPRNPRKEHFWREHLARWQTSGLSVRAYCARHRLAEPSFYAWRRTLAQRAAACQAVPPQPPVTFVPVHVQPEPTAGPPLLEVVLNNGRLLRLSAGVAPAVVRALLAVLEDEPC